MKTALAAAAALAASLLIAAPAHAASPNAAVVDDTIGCQDGIGHVTFDTLAVATKSGNVTFTCHFPAGTHAPGTNQKIDTFCFVPNHEGLPVIVTGTIKIRPDGSALMTCH